MRGARDRAERDEGRSRRGGVEGEEAVNECLSVVAQGQMSGDCDSSRARTAKWPKMCWRGGGANKEENVCQVSRATVSVDSHNNYSLCAYLSMCINIIVIIYFLRKQ